MRLTTALISDFARCRFKYWQQLTDQCELSEYEGLYAELSRDFKSRAIEHLIASHTVDDVAEQPQALSQTLRAGTHLVLGFECETDGFQLTFDAIERSSSKQNGKHEFMPIHFSPIKPSSHDKTIAACIGVLLERVQNNPINCVKIIHGPDFAISRIKLRNRDGVTKRARDAQDLLKQLAETADGKSAAPKLMLNRHCDICRFQARCFNDAVQRDDLSLLRGLPANEILALNERGVFTVRQLAHTFRAKTVTRSNVNPKRHSQPLQAMAIRDGTVYVRIKPEIPFEPTRVFLDVEGIPDRPFDYLIGMLTEHDGEWAQQHFWAESESDEESIWEAFCSKLADLREFSLYHFGRYETEFVGRMFEKYGCRNTSLAERLPASMVDIYAAIRTNVFFPVYSNRLKEIATFLGSEWTGPIRSGIDSVVRRHQWEQNPNPKGKTELIQYNYEDCLALKSVTEFLRELQTDDADNCVPTENVNHLSGPAHEKFGQARVAIPELRKITKCAYFNYQQEKVFVRTDDNVRKSVRRKYHKSKAKIRVNQEIDCLAPRSCPSCGEPSVFRHGSRRFSKTVNDLKFSRSGVKRWITKHNTHQYTCRNCRKSFYSDGYPSRRRHFGHGIATWALYQHIAGRQSIEATTDALNDLFGFSFMPKVVLAAKQDLAATYKETERQLLQVMRSGNLICADETKVKVTGKAGYVWAFSSVQEVVYRFSESRDSSVLDEILDGFDGVLVSDYYGAYDSASCDQQKCLVHLIRDINDDLLKTPFDDELKQLAERFTILLRDIVETVDRFGLKRLYLGKFVPKAKRFVRWVANQDFESKVARRYQKRIGKYGDRLFTFLSHDGVPWNNNIAENAVKMVASRRRIFGASFSEQGFHDYLLFLSIFQTLRRKGGSFLRFLLSGETDIDKFLNVKTRT